MPDQTKRKGDVSENPSASKWRAPRSSAQQGDSHRTASYDNVTTQDNARVHMGDIHGGQHTHYHEASPSHPHAGEISLLDALAFEQMNFRSATIAPAYAKTCNWLFRASPYKRWRDQDLMSEHNGFLWIKGKPGAGKSTLMKHALDHAHVTYGHEKTVSFFFNARGVALGKSVEGMYRCLLHQMVGRVPHLERSVPNADRNAYRSTGWPVAVLQGMFRQAVLHLSQQTKMSCYIDALDEGDDEDQVREMVEFFCDLAKRAVSDSLPFRVCLASRYYPKISLSFYEELRLEGHGGHDADVSEYVHNKLRLGNLQLKQQLSTEIRRRSSSVFLWVVLVVAILNKENDRGNRHLMLTRLQEIPDDLLQLFKDLRSRDPSDNRFLPAIEWVLHAMRPLEPKELYIAILTSTGALTVENFALTEQAIDTETVDDFIISSSKGFLETGTTRPHSGIRGEFSSDRRVQFIHETVREYFLVASDFRDQSVGQVRRYAIPKHCVTEPLASTTKVAVQTTVASGIPKDEVIVFRNNPGGTPELGPRSIEDTIAISHARLSQICQTYIRISHPGLRQEPQPSPSDWNPIRLSRTTRSLLQYSLTEVLDHAIAASKRGWLVTNLAEDFPWDEWVFCTFSNPYIRSNNTCVKMKTWLQRMVFVGKLELVYDELASIGTRAGSLQQGEEAAQSLLNACASGVGSALHIAASYSDSDRHMSCLKGLLENGADVNKACKDVGTPLRVAIIERNSRAVELLLQYGADPNTNDHRGNSPLHYAISDQDMVYVGILVEHGADVNSRIGHHGNAAQTAERLGGWSLRARLDDLCASVRRHKLSSAGRAERGSTIWGTWTPQGLPNVF